MVAAFPLEGTVLIALGTALDAVGLACVRLVPGPIGVCERLVRHPGVLAGPRLLRGLAVLRTDPVLVAVQAPSEIIFGFAAECDQMRV